MVPITDMLSVGLDLSCDTPVLPQQTRRFCQFAPDRQTVGVSIESTNQEMYGSCQFALEGLPRFTLFPKF